MISTGSATLACGDVRHSTWMAAEMSIAYLVVR